MLDPSTSPYVADDTPVFAVTTNGLPIAFHIDDNAFGRWVAAEGDELKRRLPHPHDDSPSSTLSDLVYRALSAGVIVGGHGLELNVHSHADGAGYFLRLNNIAGPQRLVGLTRGRHELPWPPKDLTSSEKARYHLKEICCIANMLLGSLLAPVAGFSKP